MAKARPKIPDGIRAELKYRCQLMCCVCEGKKKGDHIHHLDGDPSNNDIDNLVLLCYDHHNEASVTNSLSTTLSRADIVKFKVEWESTVEQERKHKRDQLIARGDHSVDNLYDNISALIILEFDKVFWDITRIGSKNKSSKLETLFKFGRHTNSSVYLYLLDHLVEYSSYARGGMTPEEGGCVDYIVDHYFPTEEKDEQLIIAFVQQLVYIGENIAYDAIIHLGNYRLAYSGFLILLFANYKAYKHGSDEAKRLVANMFQDLKDHYTRPERNDLGMALELRQVFEDELSKGTYRYIDVAGDLRKRIFG